MLSKHAQFQVYVRFMQKFMRTGASLPYVFTIETNA